MESYIELENLRFYAYHGAMEQERVVGNYFEVSITIKIDVIQSAELDRLDKTLNYAELYDVIKEQMQIPSFLIENVASRIIAASLRQWSNIEMIKLKVSKLNPPMEGDVGKASVILVYKKKD